jgi:uncharacterized protein (DUF1330 family)
MNEETLTGYYHMTSADENVLAYDAVPMVDLSLVYSPVLSHQWSQEPVEVMRTVGGKYLLRYGHVQNLRGKLTDTMAAEVVDEESLRLMRARYLIRRDYYALYFDCLPLAYYERDRILHDYFQGALYQPPKELLHRSRRSFRLHLEAVRHTLPPDKYTVEGQLRELHSLISE